MVASFGVAAGPADVPGLPRLKFGQLNPLFACPPGVRRALAVEPGGARFAELLRAAGWPAEPVPLLPFATLADRLRAAGAA